jgi:16S rRNA processing protein RimM
VRVVVGRVGRPSGVRGELTVQVRTDAPEHRFAAGTVLGTEPEEVGPLTVTGSRLRAGTMLVTFDGVSDRTVAESLRGVLLIADTSTAPASDEPDEYWDHDLVGLAAVHVDGSGLGLVDAVVHTPGGDLLSVRDCAGREVLVPFVAAIVPEVDLAGGRVLLDPPAGLLEL